MQHHGNRITADIEGTEIYSVSVTLNAETNTIEEYFCDCPYGEDGTPCKHLAALLCAIGDISKEELANEVKKPTIEQTVDLLSEQQMRDLLIQFARADSNIREKIQLAATKRLPGAQKKQWGIDLDALTDSAAGRYGFIDYEDAFDYCISLQEYLEERIPDLLAAGLNREAFDLTGLVFQTGIGQDMDDSDGGLTMLAVACMDVWSKILELSDLRPQQEMCQWFAAHCSSHGLEAMFLEDYVYDAPWKVEIAPQILKLLDQQLQKYLDDPMGEYYLNNLIAHRIQWMEKSGADKSETVQFIMKYHHLSAVRDIQVSRAVEEGDYDTALTILDESKELDKGKIGLVAKHSARKIEIYERLNNISALHDELKDYIFTFRQDDLIYVNKMKALLSPPEWKEMCEQLLGSASMYSQVYPLLEQEEMYEELMERIEVHTDIYALERYEALLKEMYAGRCMNVCVRP